MNLDNLIDISYQTFQEQTQVARLILLHPRSRYRSVLVAKLLHTLDTRVLYYALGPDDIDLKSLIAGLTHDLANQFPTFGIKVNGYGFLSIIPSQPDFTPFVHVHPPGESNKLTLNVEADSHATLRINDEIAWQGSVSELRKAQIQASGGRGTILTVQRMALYSLLSHN